MAARGAGRKSSDDDRTGDHSRLCAVTRAERPLDELIRFVAAPDGTITPDLARRLPGRGVWVTADKSSVASAVKRRAFARSLKRPVEVRPDLADAVEALLIRRAVDALALANKAGAVVTGFDKVDETISGGKAAVLVQAADAASGGRQKLDRKFQAIQASKGLESLIIDDLDIEQLSLAMGRSNVVHAALIYGGVTVRFAGEAARLRRYRSGISLPASTTNASTAAPIE